MERPTASFASTAMTADWTASLRFRARNERFATPVGTERDRHARHRHKRAFVSEFLRKKLSIF